MIIKSPIHLTILILIFPIIINAQTLAEKLEFLVFQKAKIDTAIKKDKLSIKNIDAPITGYLLILIIL